MGIVEKSIQCSDCGTTFNFSTEEQEIFARKGYTHDPKRCPPCRQARKTNRHQSNRRSYTTHREIFPAICTMCGRDTKVPFEPDEGRPVYCSDCYARARPSRQH